MVRIYANENFPLPTVEKLPAGPDDSNYLFGSIREMLE
jgi:hypothetical protein